MKNKTRLLFLLCCWVVVSFSCKDDFKTNPPGAPYDLRYVSVGNAREGGQIVTAPPTVQTGGLTPTFELMGISRSDGSSLDDSYLQYVHIGESHTVDIPISPDAGYVDEYGNPLTFFASENTASNGIITVAAGHTFTAGDYYFDIKVTTQDGTTKYEAVFKKAFHLNVGPLLPTNLVYTPKNQNLVYGQTDSKTSAPLLPSANPDVTYELATEEDKLVIDGKTGEVSLSPGYAYSGYDTLTPVVRVVSNITDEEVLFDGKLTTIITDRPEVMPRETIYFFYPTLRTSGSYPTGGDGFSVQVIQPGVGDDIWGEIDNSSGRAFIAPPERPQQNTTQTILENQLHNGSGVTTPTTSWMVTTTQDLTPFEYGYDLSFDYYYMPHFQTYMADGRTPADMEVYISTDYTGGTIQDANGNWLNGTWTQVNDVMRCQRSEGTAGSNSAGAPWGPAFIGTPYPGNQAGPDPDDRKRPELGTFYGKWVKCTYAIPVEQVSTTFTVAFKIASYFEGELLNNASAPGRGGIFFLSDFHYRAVEPEN
ncbi:hypothetical protein [Sphingobacterium sp. SGR-19]|uniref:hypothetical protein n=1 Tax=Sphingobacterium sp. SGR-19 TaxID=2710886 RepID=UPI0013EA5122|nr:hypothetical protein [Sphingobacterium sp. SGR-19]NGM65603.1 hypothetical protein [Sphingobacterium sp. SGR-19]